MYRLQSSDSAAGTIMRDEFSFESPLGVLGRIANALVLTRYMRAFLLERNRVIKATAESDDWRRYITMWRFDWARV